MIDAGDQSPLLMLARAGPALPALVAVFQPLLLCRSERATPADQSSRDGDPISLINDGFASLTSSPPADLPSLSRSLLHLCMWSERRVDQQDKAVTAG